MRPSYIVLLLSWFFAGCSFQSAMLSQESLDKNQVDKNVTTKERMSQVGMLKSSSYPAVSFIFPQLISPTDLSNFGRIPSSSKELRLYVQNPTTEDLLKRLQLHDDTIRRMIDGIPDYAFSSKHNEGFESIFGPGSQIVTDVFDDGSVQVTAEYLWVGPTSERNKKKPQPIVLGVSFSNSEQKTILVWYMKGIAIGRLRSALWYEITGIKEAFVKYYKVVK